MLESAVRAFSRFYTQRFGLVGRTLPGSELVLPEARVLYELSHGGPATAAEIADRLGIDKGQLSRIVARLNARGWLSQKSLAGRGGPKQLSLTPAGRAAFAELEQATQQDVGRRLGNRSEAQAEDLRLLLGTLRCQLGDSPGETRIEPPRPGDIGWVIHRQARLYWDEYGWDAGYEALITQILGDFQCGFDREREDAWIAWCGDAIAGSIFLMRGDESRVAKLRLLYVEPWARGRGVGRMLVRRCIDRAREFGYSELTLWTNHVLTAARRIYEREGFRLVNEEQHHSFGKDLVGQTWTLGL